MVEKLALFQYKMDTLTASGGADQDFDLSPPERVKMAQEHIDRTLDSTYNRLRPEVAKVQDTIHHPTIQNGDCARSQAIDRGKLANYNRDRSPRQVEPAS